MSYATIQVDKFDGRSDYSLWKTKILAHLHIQGLIKALEIEDDDGNSEDKKHLSSVLSLDLDEKKRKARSMIIQSVEDQDLRKEIMKEDTVSGMFRVLDKVHVARSPSRRIYLKYKLYGFRMKESKSIDANIDKFEDLVGELSDLGVSISDEDQAIRLLVSLPERFDQLRDVLMYSTTTLTLNHVIWAVRTKELDFGLAYDGACKNKHRDRSNSKGKKGACWLCGEDGQYKNQCPSRNFENAKEVTNTKRRSGFYKRDYCRCVEGFRGKEND